MNSKNVRGHYLRTPEGWVLQPPPQREVNGNLLPSVFNYRLGAVEPVGFSLWPLRVRLGAGPLPTLACGHLVHLSTGKPSVGTLYAYVPNEDECFLELNPTPGDYRNKHHALRRFTNLLELRDPNAAATIANTSTSVEFLPFSDDLPALYAAFAQ